MRQNLLVVHCEYAEGEKRLSELLEESFRLYLIRVLATPETDGHSLAAEWPLISGGQRCT